VARTPATQGFPVVGDEGSGIDGQRHAIELDRAPGNATLLGAVYVEGELGVGDASFEVFRVPPILRRAELVDRSEVIAIAAAATPLDTACNSMGRISGMIRRMSAPKGKETPVTFLIAS
jgi:hypothetical protein